MRQNDNVLNLWNTTALYASSSDVTSFKSMLEIDFMENYNRYDPFDMVFFTDKSDDSRLILIGMN